MSVPAPFTTITIEQGASTVEVPIHAAHGLSFDEEVIGGPITLRTISLRGIRQQHAQRRRFVFSGNGAVDPGLSGIDWAQPAALSAEHIDGGAPVSVFIDPPAINRDVHGAVVAWSLTVEEV